MNRPFVPLTVQNGTGIGITLLLAVIYFIKQRFDGISVIIAIPIIFAAVSTSTVVAQLQINLTVKFLIDVIYCDRQVINNVCDLLFVYFFIL